MESKTSSLFPSTLQASPDEALHFPKLETFRTIFNFTFPLLITAIATFYLPKLQKNRNVKSLPPGPKPWPIVGCIPEMVKRKPFFRWIHNLMKELNTDISCICLGSVHVIVVTCPSLSREFLKTQDAVFATRPTSVSTRVTSKGYLTVIFPPMGEQWKKMKRVLATEVLSPAKHRWLHSKRLEEANNLVRYVYNQCKDFDEGGVLNVRIAAQHYAGNVAKKLVFNKRFFGEGMEDGGPGREEKEHLQGLFSILEYVYNFCLSDYLPCLEGFDLDGQEKMIKKANETVAKYHDPIINERVRQWKDGEKKEVEDWLDNLITLKDSNGNALLTVDEVKAQITEIMIDNPSNAVEWTLAEMINKPHVLEKAVEELDIVVGKDRLAQESDFSKLNYIKACAREAFRLHPFTAFNVPHVSSSDTNVGDYFIPKGSHVMLSRYGLGRNPKVWDDPLKFKPERHLKDDGSDVVLSESELRFISFSTGSRGCIGVNLGTAMTTMLFAGLLQGFNWELPPGESKIDLSEERNSLVLAKPLILRARPRLPAHVYHSHLE